MLIYVLRHGLAGHPNDPEFPDDALRPLTSAGRKKTRAAVRGMKALDIQVNRIWTSALTRARQTAEIAAEELGLPRDGLRETAHLAPGVSPDLFVQHDLAMQTDDDRVMVVGHEPGLSRLVSVLLTASKDRLHLSLKKAGLAAIEWTPKSAGHYGLLKYLLTPRQLRGLGR